MSKKTIVLKQIADQIMLGVDDVEDTEKVVKLVFSLITESLVKGNKVMITGFGTFTPVLKPFHKKQAFSKEFEIEERLRIRFTPSKGLMERCRVTSQNEKSDENFLKTLQMLEE